MKRTIIIAAILIVALSILIAATETKPEVFRKDCTGCGDCVKACPVKAIEVHNGKAVIDSRKCINCKLCTTSCTFGAIR